MKFCDIVCAHGGLMFSAACRLNDFSGLFNTEYLRRCARLGRIAYFANTIWANGGVFNKEPWASDGSVKSALGNYFIGHVPQKVP